MSSPKDLSEIYSLNSYEWEKLNSKQRIQVLQNIENVLSMEQDRPSCNVTSFFGKPDELGRYNPSNPKVIGISQTVINGNSPLEALETVAHEGRHAYQNHCINFPHYHPEVEKHVIGNWKNNFKNYKTEKKDGPRAYEDQPVEVDAREYASEVVDSFCKSQKISGLQTVLQEKDRRKLKSTQLGQNEPEADGTMNVLAATNGQNSESATSGGCIREDQIKTILRRKSELEIYKAENWHDQEGIGKREEALKEERMRLLANPETREKLMTAEQDALDQRVSKTRQR